MKKIYATYRRRILNDWAWFYSPSYFFNNMFEDYLNSWLTSILDNMINEINYTWELVPWIPKLTRFLVWEYNEKYVNIDEFRQSLINTWSEFSISLFDNPEQAIARLKENTDLVEVENGKFEISKWFDDMGIDPIYLIID